MVNIELAKVDPSTIFSKPSDVLKDKTLSRSEKIDILKRWAYDEREKAVAEEENMLSIHGEKSNILDEILKCLLELGKETDIPEHPPTKHGG